MGPRRRNPPEVFRFEDWERLLSALDEWNRPIAELMLRTGVIASEAAMLQGSDILQDRLVVRGTKTAYRSREIPLTEPLRKVLQDLQDRAKGGPLITRPDGSPFKARVFWTTWKKALRAAGLSYRRPYATRHTFAIWQLLIGTHPERLVRLMGHGSKQMIYEVYGRYTEGVEEDASAIQAYLVGKTNP